MAIYILGQSNDDKGTQLEKLTIRLLENFGYKNIVRNEIGSGGHEIDVRAEFERTGLGGVETKPLICECKAHKNTTSMSDWLKFLGKVYLEEQRGNVDAYFISLNGVNGNVSGVYRDLSAKKNNVHLITGETLMMHLSQIFSLLPVTKIVEILAANTRKAAQEISYCYYDFKMWYLIGFAENSYCLLSNSGHLLSEEESAILHDLISNSTTYFNYINLRKEQDGFMRNESIKRFILSFLMVKKMHTKEALLLLFRQHSTNLELVSQPDIEIALLELEEECWIKKNKNNYSLKIKATSTVPEETAALLKYMFMAATPLIMFESSFFCNSINENLLQYILAVQGNLKIDKLKHDEIIAILKLSPSALHWSLYPDSMIVNHRNKDLVNQFIDENDASYFSQKISDLLALDFINPQFQNYFYKIKKIVELDSFKKFVVKTYQGVHLNLENRERLQLAQTSDEYNNQLLLIRLLNNQPEPWDEPAYNTKRAELG